jgi:stalled ribosome rescue protein Dom34
LSGHRHAIKEVLGDQSIVSRLEDTKAAAEVQALNEFFKMLNTDPDRAVYGEEYVAKADSIGAIAVLLLSDNVLRAKTPGERARFVYSSNSFDPNVVYPQHRDLNTQNIPNPKPNLSVSSRTFETLEERRMLSQ